MQENDIHIGATESMAGFHRFFRRIDEAEIAHFDAGPPDLFRHLLEVAFKFRLQTFELRPISLEADAE